MITPLAPPVRILAENMIETSENRGTSSSSWGDPIGHGLHFLSTVRHGGHRLPGVEQVVA